MKVVLKEPGEMPKLIEIDGKLETLQELVGGNIEHVGLTDRLGMLCNDEGKLKGEPYNFYLAAINDNIVGNAVFIGEDGEDFTDIDREDVKMLAHVMPYMVHPERRAI